VFEMWNFFMMDKELECIPKRVLKKILLHEIKIDCT
jgi:hypothetical protein